MKRRRRLECIAAMLANGQYTTAQLAAALRVSRRTIQADLQILQTEPRYCPLIYQRQSVWSMWRGEAHDGDERSVDVKTCA